MKPNDPWRDGDRDNQIGFIKKVLRETNSNVFIDLHHSLVLFWAIYS